MAYHHTNEARSLMLTIKGRLITLHRAEPTLDTAAIAKRLGTCCHTVREYNRLLGLAIPRAKNGRKRGSTGSKWYGRQKTRAARLGGMPALRLP